MKTASLLAMETPTGGGPGQSQASARTTQANPITIAMHVRRMVPRASCLPGTPGADLRSLRFARVRLIHGEPATALVIRGRARAG